MTGGFAQPTLRLTESQYATIVGHCYDGLPDEAWTILTIRVRPTSTSTCRDQSNSTCLPFLPAVVSAGWLGAMVFALALALVAWAISTMTRAGSNVPTRLPTTTIVES